MEERPNTAPADMGDETRNEEKGRGAKWFPNPKPRAGPKRRHVLIVVAILTCAYVILAAMADLAQSSAIAVFYERLSFHMEGDKRECGDRRKAYEINAHYAGTFLLKRSPEVTAKAQILDDGPCLSALFKALHDAGHGIRAVIGERTSETTLVRVEITQ